MVLLNILSKFYSAFFAVHDPVKTVKIKYRQCSFVNKEIKKSMRIRNKLHKRARLTRDPNFLFVT